MNNLVICKHNIVVTSANVNSNIPVTTPKLKVMIGAWAPFFKTFNSKIAAPINPSILRIDNIAVVCTPRCAPEMYKNMTVYSTENHLSAFNQHICM